MTIRKKSLSQKVFAAALIILCIGLAGTTALAQVDKWGAWENGITEAWSLSSRTFTNEDFANAVNRWKLIGEISSPGWEGDYFSGSEVHGTYVRWSAEAGFIIADVDKCQALVMSVTYGRVNVTPSTIQFIPEFIKPSRESHGNSHAAFGHAGIITLVPVELGRRRMLIPEDRMKEFGDYVAGVGEYNYRSDFMYSWETEFYTQDRRAAEVKTNEPSFAERKEITIGDVTIVVPRAYEQFVIKPIEARITAVGARRVVSNYSYENPDRTGGSYTNASLTFVTINAGTAHGLKTHMWLRVRDPDEGDKIRIIRVQKFSSTGIVIRDVDEDGRETFIAGDEEKPRRHSKPAIGWSLTSSLF